MQRYLKDKKGFTLIELLVVVAIIGLLASVVLASVNSARNKTKDATIKEEMEQLQNLMALNYNDYGSYCNLQPVVWVSAFGTCANLLSNGNFTGTYAPQLVNICNTIFNNANSSGGVATEILIDLPSPPACSNSYSWDVYLNDGNWYCVGSDGKGEYSSYAGTSNLGCYQDP